MGECKTKAIQTSLGTFCHNLTYPGIIQSYSGIFRTLCYPNIFKTGISRTLTHLQLKVYSEPRHIYNPGIFRTQLYSERWHIQSLRHIQNPVTHLRWSSQFITVFTKLAVLKWISWGSFSINILRYLCYVKNYDVRWGWRPWIFDILIDIFK